jgi:hypothetical protein
VSVRPRQAAAPGPWRSFDPHRVGALECAMWVAYYRREWIRLLRAATAVVRHGFGMPSPATLRAARLLLRANRLWARDDADGARRCMQGFYALVARRHGEALDAERAAELEVEWWRAHRAREYGADGGASPLVEALVALYAHLYDVAPGDVRRAAEQRVQAMALSDGWVGDGCRSDSPLLAQQRAALVRSHAALLAAVHR